MPRAGVATSALTRLSIRSSSAASRCVGSVCPEHATTANPRPPRGGEILGKPRQPLRVCCQVQDSQVQRLAVQAAAQHHNIRRLLAETQYVGDVGDDPRVGGSGGHQHRNAVGQRGQQCAQPTEVGPKLLVPVRNAMRLIDDKRPGSRRRTPTPPRGRPPTCAATHELWSMRSTGRTTMCRDQASTITNAHTRRTRSASGVQPPGYSPTPAAHARRAADGVGGCGSGRASERSPRWIRRFIGA